ncbi:MAG: Hpt domain-containing protein [Gemmatimonadetes bacterium]|nr:Hpt domain-containing protein [Gemmatimonadota bacterium]
MSNPTTAVDESTSHEETPPPEMHEALALVQRIGGRDLLTKVIGLFRTTSEQRLGAMRAAVAGDERQQLSRLAHAMKGSAAQVGLSRCAPSRRRWRRRPLASAPPTCRPASTS